MLNTDHCLKPKSNQQKKFACNSYQIVHQDYGFISSIDALNFTLDTGHYLFTNRPDTKIVLKR